MYLYDNNLIKGTKNKKIILFAKEDFPYIIFHDKDNTSNKNPEKFQKSGFGEESMKKKKTIENFKARQREERLRTLLR